MLIGLSSTHGRCSRRCLICWASDSVVTLHRAQRTSGWRWSACWRVPLAMRCSSVTRRPSSSPLTLPEDSTTTRSAPLPRSPLIHLSHFICFRSILENKFLFRSVGSTVSTVLLFNTLCSLEHNTDALSSKMRCDLFFSSVSIGFYRMLLNN